MELDNLQLEIDHLSIRDNHTSPMLKDISKDLRHVRNLLRCHLADDQDMVLSPPLELLRIDTTCTSVQQESMDDRCRWPNKNANREFRNVSLFI